MNLNENRLKPRLAFLLNYIGRFTITHRTDTCTNPGPIISGCPWTGNISPCTYSLIFMVFADFYKQVVNKWLKVNIKFFKWKSWKTIMNRTFKCYFTFVRILEYSRCSVTNSNIPFSHSDIYQPVKSKCQLRTFIFNRI